MTVCATLLRAIMLDRGLKPYLVAEQFGMSRGAIYGVISGRLKPSPRIIEAVCTAANSSQEQRENLHLLGAREAGWKV